MRGLGRILRASHQTQVPAGNVGVEPFSEAPLQMRRRRFTVDGIDAGRRPAGGIGASSAH